MASHKYAVCFREVPILLGGKTALVFQTNLRLFLQLNSLKIKWMIVNISIYPLCDDLRSKVLLCDQYASFFVEGEANKLNVNL